MNETDCRAVRREIDESELGQRLSGQVESHVALCAACAEFRSQRSRLRELVGSLAPVTAPADFDMRLRARIARDNAARSRQPFIFRFVMSTPGIAVAALAVMLVAGLVWFNQRTPVQTSNAASTNPVKEKPVAPVAPSVGPENPTGSRPTVVVAAAAPDKRPSAGRQYPNKTTDNGPRSSDFNSSPAESVRLAQDRAGEVSLSAPVNPMVVTVRDERGGSRKILLPAVSFGSQRLTDSRVPVNMTNSRDW
jgi:hypothetical protein